MLRILYGSCTAALDAFRAADNPVDEELVADLEKMVERTRNEIERLSTRDAGHPARRPGSSYLGNADDEEGDRHVLAGERDDRERVE